MTIQWRFYPTCQTCGAAPAKPCPGRWGARTAPHTGRRRQKTDQTPPPPPPVYCTAEHPAYRFVRCSREAHRDSGHVHYSQQLGLIHWMTAPYIPPAQA